MKAENLGIAEVPDHTSLVRTAEPVGGVEEELQLAPRGDFREFVDVAGTAPQMNGEHRCRPRRNQLLNATMVQRVGLGIDVTEDGCDAEPLQGLNRGREGSWIR